MLWVAVPIRTIENAVTARSVPTVIVEPFAAVAGADVIVGRAAG